MLDAPDVSPDRRSDPFAPLTTRHLSVGGGHEIYVETENSVYLLTFRAEPLRELPHALAAVTSSRQRKG